MPEREPEVPLDLKREIEALDETATGGYDDVAAFVDALPEQLPEACPDCGGSLSPAAVFTTGDEEPIAVRLVCMASHGGGRVATFIYEVAERELYLEREEKPESAFDGWDGADDAYD